MLVGEKNQTRDTAVLRKYCRQLYFLKQVIEN